MRRTAPGRLGVRYVLEAELAGLQLQAPEGRELWQHTCFEVFLAPHGTSRYYEFNFSASGAWAAYAFSAYRKGGRLHEASLEPRVVARTTQAGLELEAVLSLAPLDLPGEVAAGLSAVIESAQGDLSYWALRHAPGKPDFHHPDSFTVRLDALRH